MSVTGEEAVRLIELRQSIREAEENLIQARRVFTHAWSVMPVPAAFEDLFYEKERCRQLVCTLRLEYQKIAGRPHP